MTVSNLRPPTRARSSTRTETLYVRLGLKIFIALVLLVALIWGGRTTFLRLQQKRLIRQAAASLEKGDKRWATIAARRVFELNPKNPDAGRIFARIAEGEDSAVAVEWRQQVTSVVPDSIPDLIALARDAVRFERKEIAEQTFAKLAGKAEGLADYHAVRGQFAFQQNDVKSAAEHFAVAARIEPRNKDYELSFAIARLRSGTPEEAIAARMQIRGLLKDSTVRTLAARALRDDALQQRDQMELVEATAVLFDDPGAEVSERINHLRLLHQANDPDFARKLSQLQEEIVSSPRGLYEVLTWMGSDGLSLLALEWVKRLPADLIRKVPPAVGVANCFLAARDWPALHAWCKDASWEHLEFMRHVCLARAFREEGNDLDARLEWGETMKLVGSDAARISALQQEMVRWNWTKEAADLLWQLARDPSRQNGALAALYKFYAERGLTSDLYRVVMRLMELRPDDTGVLNNFAQLSLLLNLNVPRAYDVAEQLHAREARNPAFASTYAYSLSDRGRIGEALRVMNSLSPEELRTPGIAAYYGILLTAAGEKATAADYLRLGAAAVLLPEERTALERATRAAQ